MAVFRVPKHTNYSVLSNIPLKDNRLTLKAKGILAVMLSLPDDWDYSIEGLTTLSFDGISTVRSTLKELEKYGYLERSPIRKGNRIVDWEYRIYENPNENPSFLLADFLQVENLQVESLLVENRTQLNTNIQSTKTQSTNKLSTDKESMEKRKRFIPPTLDEVRAYCLERGNNIDPERFIDYYIANGWTQGKGKPIKDWKAAVRNWERNDIDKPYQKQQQTYQQGKPQNHYQQVKPKQSELSSFLSSMQEFLNEEE